MSAPDAIQALKRMGLQTYEAELFVALHQRGAGTAADVSEHSDVPRSQVYGAADDLAERGLVEVVESSPKRYRPVDLEAARAQLRERQRREREQAFDTLENLDRKRQDADGEQDVSTLRGRQPIAARVSSLIADASEEVIFVAPGTAQLSEAILGALIGRAQAGVLVRVATARQAVAEEFADTPVRVIVMDEDTPGDYTGRTLMVDDEAVLLSVVTREGDGVDEEAMWTAGTSIARILAQFVHSGMEAGMEPRERPS